MNNYLSDFLTDLLALCERYNLYIAGCGCCGSPFLVDKNGDKIEMIPENLEFSCEDFPRYSVRLCNGRFVHSKNIGAE